jgi:hypothetical protein
MWVQFTNPRSLQLVNSLKIQWNHLAYKDTFCCSEYGGQMSSHLILCFTKLFYHSYFWFGLIHNKQQQNV